MDTGGFTDHVFAACSILGYAFVPAHPGTTEHPTGAPRTHSRTCPGKERPGKSTKSGTEGRWKQRRIEIAETDAQASGAGRGGVYELVMRFAEKRSPGIGTAAGRPRRNGPRERCAAQACYKANERRSRGTGQHGRPALGNERPGKSMKSGTGGRWKQRRIEIAETDAQGKRGAAACTN